MGDTIYHLPSFLFPHLTGVALPAFIAIPGSPGDIVVHGVSGLAAGLCFSLGLAIRRWSRPTLSAFALTFGFVRLMQQFDLITIHFDRIQAVGWRIVHASYNLYTKLLLASTTDTPPPEQSGVPLSQDEQDVSLLKAYLTSIPFACLVGGFLMTWLF